MLCETGLRSCVKVEVADPVGSAALTVWMVSADIKQHLTKKNLIG